MRKFWSISWEKCLCLAYFISSFSSRKYVTSLQCCRISPHKLHFCTSDQNLRQKSRRYIIETNLIFSSILQTWNGVSFLRAGNEEMGCKTQTNPNCMFILVHLAQKTWKTPDSTKSFLSAEKALSSARKVMKKPGNLRINRRFWFLCIPLPMFPVQPVLKC